MVRPAGLLLALLLILGISDAQASWWGCRPFGPVAVGPGFGGFTVAGQFGFSRGPFRVRGGFVGGQLYGCGPGLPWWGGPGWSPWCGPGWRSVNVVSVVAPPPTIVFLPLPARPFDPPGDDLPDVPRVAPPIMPPAPPPAPVPPPPVPQADRPRKERERQPEAPAQPPRPDAPEAEYDRLIQQAREAFQTQEYGRAAARVRQALRLPERQPDAWFLLGQALIAQGKYHEAHDALVQGLRLRPDWPQSDFRPLELFDEAAEYSAHLQAAQQAWQRHPADPCLLFVVGYLLWFDGRRDEASDLFRRLLPLPLEGRSAELFLRALPAGPTL